jgi:glycosyltransferase involved in cell wall biosynthesis
VKFAGHLDHSTLLNLYATGKVDFVILPSLHEGIPVSLMEAMGYGIPVISTDVGGTSELLCDGAGILVPPKNHKALADATEKLIQLPHLREELSQLGRRRVEEQFAVEYTVSDLVDCIESD